MLRVFGHYVSGKKLAFFFTESLTLALTSVVGAGVVLRLQGDGGATWGISRLLWDRAWMPWAAGVGLCFVGLLQLSLYAFDLYDWKTAAQDQGRGARVLRALGVGLLLASLGAWLGPALPSGLLLGGATGSLLGAVLSRLGLRQWAQAPRRIILVGNGRSARELEGLIELEGDPGFEIVTKLDPTLPELRAEPRALTRRTVEVGAKCVVLALDEPRGAIPAEAIFRCRVAGLPVYSAAAFCERVLRRLPVAQLRVSDLAFSDELTQSALRRGLKRVFDLAAAGLLLVATAPVMAVVAVLIKLDSEGPLLYRQERVGADGRTYGLWKFRSMRVDAEKDGAVWAKLNDDRVTRVGRIIRKTRVDELPQVFNVLRGDMSFVGPRPERPVFVEKLRQEIPHYGLREAVKPGITGWAQIRYPYGASVEDARNKLEFDLYYVKNGSLFLDMAIMFHTVRHVLFGKGAR